MPLNSRRSREIFREGKKSKQKEVLLILQKDLQLQHLPLSLSVLTIQIYKEPHQSPPWFGLLTGNQKKKDIAILI